MLVFWKDELKELQASSQSFFDVYRIMKERFSDEIFSEEYINGETVTTTYRELFEGAESVASELSKRYADKKGECIAIRMNNSPMWVKCFFGSLMAGFVPLLINTRLPEQGIEYALRISKAFAVLCDSELRDDRYVDPSTFQTGKFESAKWADEIYLMSSGTTGNPKLVIFSGKAICKQILESGWVVKQNPYIKHDRKLQIRLLALLPFYHIFGLSTVLMWFGFFGRTLIFPPGADSESIQYACKVGGVTHFFAIPLVWNTAVRKLIAEAKKQGQEKKLRKAVKISNSLQSVFPRFGAFVARNVLFRDVRRQVFGESVTFCISGGGFISGETLEILNGIGYSMYPGYGMTETGITSVDLSRKANLRNDNTVGRPFENVEYKFSETGSLMVKSELLCSGFLTEKGKVYRDENSYFDTGDMCTADERGRWVLTGRQDDVIIGENGENISPDAIEQQLPAFPDAVLCVLGLEHSGTVRPSVVLGVSKGVSSFGRAVMISKIFTAIEKLPLTHRPAQVLVTEDEVPENLGKVKRAELLRKIKSGEITTQKAQPVNTEDFSKIYDESLKETLREVKNCFAEVLLTEVDKIGDNDNFIYDLGGDSMSYFNLFSVISKHFETEVEMKQSKPLFTPLDFARELTGKGNAV
ncbi:MAG: AMP-binding protein [Ruminococcus sp.]